MIKMSRYYQAMDDIENDPALSPKDKREYLSELSDELVEAEERGQVIYDV